jgi:uncharacterized protein (TIGR03067 family)
VLATPLLLAADGGDDIRKELKALQGKWKTVASEAEGKPFPKDGIPPFTVVIAADGKSTGQTQQEEFRFTRSESDSLSPSATRTWPAPLSRR